MRGSFASRIGLFQLGLFSVCGVVLFGVLIILAGELRLFADTYELKARFPSVEGLMKNDLVTLGGVEIGRVHAMEVVDQHVELRLEIDKNVLVRADSVASIRMLSLFGGKTVALTIGSPDARFLRPGEEVATAEGFGVDLIMEQFAEAVSDAREFLVSVNENQDKVLNKIYAMLEENESDLRETVTAFHDAAESVRDAAPKLDEFLDSATEIARRIEAGDGTMGKLLASDDVYMDIRDLAGTLQSAAETADRILRDNEPDIREAVASLADAGRSLNETLDRVASLARKIDEGEGTLGLAVNDPALYEEARQALDRVNDAAEGVREQIPMTAFLSVLFSAFGG